MRACWAVCASIPARDVSGGGPGVPVATQKLMTKSAWKGTLKDDVALSTLAIPEGTEVRGCIHPPRPAPARARAARTLC